jgi:predicted nucleic acid-binding Zn ribbon protein
MASGIAQPERIMVTDEKRSCTHCGKTLQGRSDKKFCDDYCRNAFNNRQNSDRNNLVRTINNTLLKNRRLLESAIRPGEDLVKTTRQKLMEQGFDFRYFTHQYQNKKGQTYNFCYEYGYLPLEGEYVLIVHRKSDA